MADFYTGFQSDPFAMQSTLLTGPTTYNLMGATPAAPAVPAPTDGFGTISTAGAILGAIGGFITAKGQRDMLKYRAQVNELNAVHARNMGELAAQSALMAGEREIARHGLKVKQLKGAQRAALAANGVDLGVGSAAEVQASTDILSEIDRNTIEANAVRAAWGYRQQGAAGALAASTQAIGDRATASAISPWMAAGSSLLTSAARVSDPWYRRNRQEQPIA